MTDSPTSRSIPTKNPSNMEHRIDTHRGYRQTPRIQPDVPRCPATRIPAIFVELLDLPCIASVVFSSTTKAESERPAMLALRYYVAYASPPSPPDGTRRRLPPKGLP